MSLPTTTYTPELTRLLGRAAIVNQSYETDWDASFTSVLLAFLISDDPVSRWLQDYVRTAGVDRTELLGARNLINSDGTDRLSEFAARPLPFEAPPSNVQSNVPDAPADFQRWLVGQRLTSSAENILSIATRLRDGVTGTGEPLDVRHVLGAYIYDPAGHDADLKKWQFDRRQWSNAFLGLMRERQPAELEQWKEQHRGAFGGEPEIRRGVEVGGGPSSHIATDVWTTEDALGYQAYAYALYRFLTHPKTRPPLTISIQAAWGGGKTSLMRMIQRELDPQAAGQLDFAPPPATLSVREVKQKISRWMKAKGPEDLPRVELLTDQAGGPARRLTVWLNVWKYQNTQQVWAGLADAIIRQVAARLPNDQQELFWLSLNWQRLDLERWQQDVRKRALREWLQAERRWLPWTFAGVILAAAISALINWATPVISGEVAGWALIALTGLGTAAQLLREYGDLQKKAQAEADEAVAAKLSNYLDVPDYREQLGFLHHAEADLRRILRSVPDPYRPIVIFIDDLDRCSPERVAELIEAVNLFLAGDIPDCMFVLGMDAEMVAAALEAAHAKVIAHLPPDTSTPIGWRFMDKFVQLPVLIPPAEPGDLQRYLESMLTVKASGPEAERALAEADELAARSASLAGLNQAAEQFAQQRQLSPQQAAAVRQAAEARLVRREVDARVEAYSDDNEDIRRRILAAAPSFSHAPRELKRFINSFRFHYFLWSARQARELEGGLSLDQLQRWVVLAMKWPEVVRWLRRGGGRERRRGADGKPLTPSRLARLEAIGARSADLAAWQSAAAADLRLTPAEARWLNDDDLRVFFLDEGQRPAGERLSAAEGRGLW